MDLPQPGGLRPRAIDLDISYAPAITSWVAGASVLTMVGYWGSNFVAVLLEFLPKLPRAGSSRTFGIWLSLPVAANPHLQRWDYVCVLHPCIVR